MQRIVLTFMLVQYNREIMQYNNSNKYVDSVVLTDFID